MKARGCRRALGIILSALQTEASWDRYVDDVAAAREQVGPAARGRLRAAVERAPRLHRGHRGPRARRARGRSSRARRADARLVFTAHSIPIAMAEGSPYVAELETAARAVAARSAGRGGRSPTRAAAAPRAIRGSSPTSTTSSARLGAGRRARRGGRPDRLRLRPRRGALRPRRRGAAAAEACGIGFHRAAAVNDHPAFIAMLADVVRRGRARREADRRRRRASPGSPPRIGRSSWRASAAGRSS